MKDRFLQRWSKANGPPSKKHLSQLLDQVLTVLDGESPDRRPRNKADRPGGLVQLDPQRPLIVVPDLHARREFLTALMKWEMQGRSVAELMEEGSLQIVCLGDGFHSEAREILRWRAAYREFSTGFTESRNMDAEMTESLGLMLMVMSLKCRFPDNFHFLKGNHENVLNEYGAGNYPFGKFVEEGAMVAAWMQRRYSSFLIDEYAAFEKKLPLLAVGSTVLLSHAEPKTFFPREEVVEYRDHPDVVLGLTWTDNNAAEEGSVRRMLDGYLPSANQARYIGGHRCIARAYNLRAGGLFVQIHNPDRYNIAYVVPQRPFDPATDVLAL